MVILTVALCLLLAWHQFEVRNKNRATLAHTTVLLRAPGKPLSAQANAFRASILGSP